MTNDEWTTVIEIESVGSAKMPNAKSAFIYCSSVAAARRQIPTRSPMASMLAIQLLALPNKVMFMDTIC